MPDGNCACATRADGGFKPPLREDKKEGDLAAPAND
jgi:hypothetical protein